MLKCEGAYCELLYTLTVSTEGAVSDLSPVSDCKYGDVVKLDSVGGTSNDMFAVYEIAIVGKSGKLPFRKIEHDSVCTLHIVHYLLLVRELSHI